jgi:subtilase family serine protease
MTFRRDSSHLKVVILTLLISGSLAAAASAQSTQIPNNTPGFIKKAVDLGPTDPSTVITATVWVKLQNENKLGQLVRQQQTKGSPSYHEWIDQAGFNALFAPTAQAVNAVQNFLMAHNLAVLHVAENNFYVKAQGTVADMQQAFHVSIHNYKLKDQTYRSNAADPSVSSKTVGLIAGITGLDDFGFQPAFVRPTSPEGTASPMVPLSVGPNGVFFEGQCFRGVETDTFTGGGNTATYTGNRYGSDITSNTLGHLPPCGYSPDEMQTAYNLKSLYTDGLDGTGETVVITDAFGSPTIFQDAQVFSAVYGLPPITADNFQVLRAPGAVNNPHGVAGFWDLETTLDVEWVHAIAPGAKIVLVIGPTNHADLDEAINWAVVHHLGNTISNSWSTIEGFGNPVVFERVNRILQMAAVQGIDVNFATGDFGDEVVRVGAVRVDFPASSPFATGIGGTSLALNPDNTAAFQTGWGNNLTRIADLLSLGSPPVVPPLHLGFQGGAGGGSSILYPKPSFQTGVPGTMRGVPDISMLADPFTGAEFIQTVGGVLGVGVVGGTSLATPMFSAVMAIAAQKAGHPLGQAAPLVYNLPAGAVTDVLPVSSPGNVTGIINGSPASADSLAAPLGNTTSYYSALYNSPFSTRWFVITFGTDSSLTVTPGWDNVTGVGTPNGVNFVNAIAP